MNINNLNCFKIYKISPHLSYCFTELYKTIDNAVLKLSDDIYSSGTRIQNADDNQYSENSTP